MSAEIASEVRVNNDSVCKRELTTVSIELHKF